MKTGNHLRKRAASAAVAVAVSAGAVAIAGAVAGVGLATSASAAPPGTALTRAVTLHLRLAPMPTGQVVLGKSGVSLAGYGFTPGSSHAVALSLPQSEVPIGTLTASAAGAVNWSASLSTVKSALARHGVRMDASGATSPSVQLNILNADQGTPVIAQTPAITSLGRYPVHAVELNGGRIKPGSATIVYNPAAKTISVTVNATGLTPGGHAAHIHLGSCQRQGAVFSMLKDFTANSRGVISNETRTVTGVTAPKLSGGWYLNLHQGNSNDILSNGQPTIYFRPLDCANI
jgi:Cu/Zn superoxide dismutase